MNEHEEMEYEQDAPYRLLTGIKFGMLFSSPFWIFACYVAWRIFR